MQSSAAQQQKPTLLKPTCLEAALGSFGGFGPYLKTQLNFTLLLGVWQRVSSLFEAPLATGPLHTAKKELYGNLYNTA